MKTQPTLLLVHGAWQSSWAWRDVADLFDRENCEFIVPDLPGHGVNPQPYNEITISTYADFIISEIEKLNAEKIILIGHSMGGLVISQVAETIPDKIHQLIYITAFIPETNESLLDLAQQSDIEGLSKHTRWLDNDCAVALRTKGLGDILFNDCTAEQVKYALAHLEKEPAQTFGNKVRVTPDNMGRVPKVYIECEKDQAISLNMQRSMHQAHGCKIESLAAGHEPNVSQPEALVKLIMKHVSVRDYYA